MDKQCSKCINVIFSCYDGDVLSKECETILCSDCPCNDCDKDNLSLFQQRQYDSNEEAIETVARNLGGNNPNTERHYANKNLKEILRAYNPPSIVPKYAEQVISIMNAIGDEHLGEEANS